MESVYLPLQLLQLQGSPRLVKLGIQTPEVTLQATHRNKLEF
jgi:hypothetical protein